MSAWQFYLLNYQIPLHSSLSWVAELSKYITISSSGKRYAYFFDCLNCILNVISIVLSSGICNT